MLKIDGLGCNQDVYTSVNNSIFNDSIQSREIPQ